MIKVWLLSSLFMVCQGDDQTYRCPSNLARNSYLKTFGGKCYQFNNYETSWFTARDTCSSRGGCLVQIRTAQIQQFVMKSLRSLNWNRNGVWMGAHDLDDEGHWKWVEGYPLTYTNWAPDQPEGCTLFFCVEDCGHLRYNEEGLWYDYPCNLPRFTYSFICEFYMRPVTTTTVRTQPTLFTTTPNIPTTNARLQQETMTTLLPTESTSSTTIKAPIPTVTLSRTTSVATNTTANGTITPVLKRAIPAIFLSLLLFVSICGFVSVFMQVKRRRNKMSQQENRMINFVNETSANLPPDSTNLDVNQSSGHLVSHGTPLELPHVYDYVNNRSSACCRDKKPIVHAEDEKIHTESREKAKLPSHESGQADTLSSVYENLSEVDISELDDTYQYI